MNSQLIAAAPDLLAACLRVKAACGEANNWSGETRGFLELVDIAIKKAGVNSQTDTGAVEDYEILNAMSRYGGSFAQAISRAAQLADQENLSRIKAAFPELWNTYAGFVSLTTKEDNK